MLEAEKQALNPPVSSLAAMRVAPESLGGLVTAMLNHSAKTSAPSVPPYFEGLTLPKTEIEKSELEEAMGKIRDAFDCADPSVKAEVNAAGMALANDKVPRGSVAWDQWCRIGVYHAFMANRGAAARAENAARAKAMDQETDRLDQENHQD